MPKFPHFNDKFEGTLSGLFSDNDGKVNIDWYIITPTRKALFYYKRFLLFSYLLK